MPPRLKRRVRLTAAMPLDPAYEIAPLSELIRRSQTNVLLGLRLAEKVDVWPPPTQEELAFAQVSFGGPPLDPVVTTERFKSWVLLNGFEDIHKSLRVALERSFVFGTISSLLLTEPELDIRSRESELSGKARSCHFPELTKLVTSALGEPLPDLAAMESFNCVRNCLEHTNGQVTVRHCNNPTKDQLTIHGRRFRYFFKRGDLEVPAELGKPGPENAALMLGVERFEIPFSLAQPIDLSLKQFVDVLNTCVLICADLDVRLKKLPQRGAV